MTKEEIKSLIFVCPYHGRISREYVTTMKTCVAEMEAMEALEKEKRWAKGESGK